MGPGDNGGPGTMIHGKIINWFPYLLHLDMYIGNANCNIRSLEHIFFHFVRQDSNLTNCEERCIFTNCDDLIFTKDGHKISILHSLIIDHSANIK